MDVSPSFLLVSGAIASVGLILWAWRRRVALINADPIGSPNDRGDYSVNEHGDNCELATPSADYLHPTDPAPVVVGERYEEIQQGGMTVAAAVVESRNSREEVTTGSPPVALSEDSTIRGESIDCTPEIIPAIEEPHIFEPPCASSTAGGRSEGENVAIPEHFLDRLTFAAAPAARAPIGPLDSVTNREAEKVPGKDVEIDAPDLVVAKISAEDEYTATDSLETRQQRPPTVHRDRRGERRTATSPKGQLAESGVQPLLSIRPAAEARLRLVLHPIRQTALLSAVLTRPEGFPEHITLRLEADTPVHAYSQQRYDDVDLPWTAASLDNELRFTSVENYRWVRSARRIHIFVEEASEPGLISVGAVRVGATHAIICRSAVVPSVCEAALSAGSPALTAHDHWQGIPDGWTVLSGYRPLRAVTATLTAALRPLDPGIGTDIVFEGGLELHSKVFAEGRLPLIKIHPVPEEVSVTIGGQPAVYTPKGGWEAPGWDAPGQHLIDVVPGPSTAYEVVADPANNGGWKFWNAHPSRFGDTASEPWMRAEICGSLVKGPLGQAVLAVDAAPMTIALGAKRSVLSLRYRTDVLASVGFLKELPAFLVSASGPRRNQGKVIWLGYSALSEGPAYLDFDWALAVRQAAARRLPLKEADELGEAAWRNAKKRARCLKRRHR